MAVLALLLARVMDILHVLPLSIKPRGFVLNTCILIADRPVAALYLGIVVAMLILGGASSC